MAASVQATDHSLACFARHPLLVSCVAVGVCIQTSKFCCTCLCDVCVAQPTLSGRAIQVASNLAASRQPGTPMGVLFIYLMMAQPMHLLACLAPYARHSQFSLLALILHTALDVFKSTGCSHKWMICCLLFWSVGRPAAWSYMV